MIAFPSASHAMQAACHGLLLHMEPELLCASLLGRFDMVCFGPGAQCHLAHLHSHQLKSDTQDCKQRIFLKSLHECLTCITWVSSQAQCC